MRLGSQCLLAQGPGGPDRGEDPASAADDLLVALPLEAALEFNRAMTSVNEVGMRVDKPWRQPAPCPVDQFPFKQGEIDLRQGRQSPDPALTDTEDVPFQSAVRRLDRTIAGRHSNVKPDTVALK